MLTRDFCVWPEVQSPFLCQFVFSVYLQFKPDTFHALGRFIFKRQFWQHMMIYGTLRYGTVTVRYGAVRLIVHVKMFFFFLWQGISLIK